MFRFKLLWTDNLHPVDENKHFLVPKKEASNRHACLRDSSFYAKMDVA